MVYTNRPITKYCCSDLPQTEIHILANFSIFSTFTCLFIIFLAFAHLQSQENSSNHSNSTKSYTKFESILNITSPCFNETNENETQVNCTSENIGDIFVQHIEPETTRGIPIPSTGTKKSTSRNSTTAKKESISTLDWICRLFVWEPKVETFWILLPFLWNIFDLFRALLLLIAIKRRSSCLLKLWYVLTSGNTVNGILIFYPIFSKYKGGDLQVTFVVIFLLLLFYNCYSLWIVNVFLKKMKMILSPSEQVLDLSTHEGGMSNSESTHVERF